MVDWWGDGVMEWWGDGVAPFLRAASILAPLLMSSRTISRWPIHAATDRGGDGDVTRTERTNVGRWIGGAGKHERNERTSDGGSEGPVREGRLGTQAQVRSRTRR